MKLIKTTALILALASPLHAQSVTIENGAYISGTSEWPKSKLVSITPAAANVVRAFGYKCDTVSSFSPFILSRGFTLVCNNFSYKYEIADRGGNWVATLK